MAQLITPTEHDVLLGRGKTYHNHKGNQRFRAIIAVYIPKYADEQTTRNEKTRIVESIVEDIYQDGCRFLKQELPSCVWYEIGFQRAKDKVGHALRDATAEMHRSFKRAELVRASRNTRQTVPFESTATSNTQPNEISAKQAARKKDDDSDSCESDSGDLFPASGDFKYANIEPISIEKIERSSQHRIGDIQPLNVAEGEVVSTNDTVVVAEDDFFSSILDMLNQASNVMKDSDDPA